MRSPVIELPGVADIKAALDAVEAAATRKDLPPRDLLRFQQEKLITFWHTCCRYHAQAEAVAILNEARIEIFRRPPLKLEQCPRLYVTRRIGGRRSMIDFHPSTSRIALQLFALPGAANYLAKIAAALDAELSTIKALHKEHFREARRAAA